MAGQMAERLQEVQRLGRTRLQVRPVAGGSLAIGRLYDGLRPMRSAGLHKRGQLPSLRQADAEHNPRSMRGRTGAVQRVRLELQRRRATMVSRTATNSTGENHGKINACTGRSGSGPPRAENLQRGLTESIKRLPRALYH